MWDDATGMDTLPADRLGFGSITPDTPGASGMPGTTVDAHVDLLALFFTLSAILAGLTAASLLALGLGAAAGSGSGSGSGRAGAGDGDVAAGFAAILFIGVTVTVGAFAGACAATATGLRRRRPWSRPAALVLALVMLVIAPFGTALGLYAFWVLLRQRAREMLGAETGGQA
jgi:hypothetical protein